MGFADTDRNRAAAHEAGHALIAASRGVGVAAIEIYGTDGSGTTHLREEPSDLDRVWILYGGPAAEEIFFGQWTLASRPAGLDDLLLAHSLCRHIGITDMRGIAKKLRNFFERSRFSLSSLQSGCWLPIRCAVLSLMTYFRKSIDAKRTAVSMSVIYTPVNPEFSPPRNG
jgi:Peptidase M50B-like